MAIEAQAAYQKGSDEATLTLAQTRDLKSSRKKYKLGALYSVITAILLATQHPFSALAAKKLSSVQFVRVTMRLASDGAVASLVLNDQAGFLARRCFKWVERPALRLR